MPLLTQAAFKAHLVALAVPESSQKLYMGAFRRLTRDLTTDDLKDPTLLRQYRDSMKQGTRNIFDGMWSRLRTMPEAREITLATWDRLPYMKFAHPLFADMTFLSGYYGTEKLSQKTWKDAEGDIEREQLVRAARRCFGFFCGNAEPLPMDPLVVRNAAKDPMMPWQIEYIVNSELSAGTFDACSLMREVVSRISVTDFDAAFLRTACDKIVASRTDLKSADFQALKKDLMAAFDRKNHGAVRFLIEQLPATDESGGTTIMW